MRSTGGCTAAIILAALLVSSAHGQGQLPHARGRRGRPLALGASAEAFLGACGQTLASVAHLGPPAHWYTARDACAVLGRYDSVLMLGDSLTRQARLAPPRGRAAALPAGARERLPAP
jgi:hypothetical protein